MSFITQNKDGKLCMCIAYCIYAKLNFITMNVRLIIVDKNIDTCLQRRQVYNNLLIQKGKQFEITNKDDFQAEI